MNGSEHYREAERLIGKVKTYDGHPDGGYKHNADTIALAQVHATLARAAFQAVAIGATTINNPDPGTSQSGPRPPVTDVSWLEMEGWTPRPHPDPRVGPGS